MNLIDRSDLLNATNAGKFPSSSFTNLLMNTLKINKVNELYSQNQEKQHLEFLDAVLDDLGVKYEIDADELNKLPSEGPFITISNHPFGGIDGLLLLKIISMKRNDFKLVGNYLLERIEPLKEYIFSVNPFETIRSSRSSVVGLKHAYEHLLENHPLGIFPAGEVSTIDGRVVQDKQWVNAALKFIKAAHVPVVPVYFHGNNSVWFHLLGAINPLFRTAKLPSELFNKKGKVLKIRIGSPIAVEEQQAFKNVSQYGRFLRAKTYALGSPIEVKKFYQFQLKRQGKQEEIIEQDPVTDFEKEIKALPENNLLFKSSDYEVYCASANHIPKILQEIGRLREITFRAIGEGTNRSSDIDEYDLYYQHIFIWDASKKRIVGGYRVGLGKDIIKQYGVKGFYINSLFNVKKDMKPILERSLELGRSFVVQDYQKKPTSLFLLWKGILYMLLKNPDYRYLIGPVSISNSYSNFSKSLIIDFIHSNYFHHQYANMVSPKKKFKVNYRNVDYQIILDSTQGDINKLDKMIEEIELRHYKIPVLFKKYLKQNARIMGFNVDPRFNKALDGLMILDLLEVPIKTIQSLSKEFNDHSLMDRFYAKHALDEYARIPQL